MRLTLLSQELVSLTEICEILLEQIRNYSCLERVPMSDIPHPGDFRVEEIEEKEEFVDS